MNVKLSVDGLRMLKRFEGFRPLPYHDVAGFPTVGYGHLIKNSENFNEGLTEDEAGLLLADDVRWAERAVEELVKVDLSQNEFDALVSLVFNIGRTNFAKSTLLRVLNEGRRMSAADEFLKWRKAGGKVVSGLENRRRAEAHVFLLGYRE